MAEGIFFAHFNLFKNGIWENERIMLLIEMNVNGSGHVHNRDILLL